MSFTPAPPVVQDASSFFGASVDVLRLDSIHPIVSGNKWYKLKGYLAEAKATGKQTLLTFGGAYSNHIVATAAAAQMQGLKSIGIIRGERPVVLSHTLQAAIVYGMHLHFVPRGSYRLKAIPGEVLNIHPLSSLLIVPEGGYGKTGMIGAKEIMASVDASPYIHIVCAVGTGTTAAGLISAAASHQTIVGISALKNAYSLQQEIEALLPEEHACFNLLHNYHFGGYAKHTPDLIAFMNKVYKATAIPTDFVYTAKAFYAVHQLLQQGFFAPSARILLIHTGGLQGNCSLPDEALIFRS